MFPGWSTSKKILKNKRIVGISHGGLRPGHPLFLPRHRVPLFFLLPHFFHHLSFLLHFLGDHEPHKISLRGVYLGETRQQQKKIEKFKKVLTKKQNILKTSISKTFFSFKFHK
jgi:hypothetical protein